MPYTHSWNLDELEAKYDRDHPIYGPLIARAADLGNYTKKTMAPLDALFALEAQVLPAQAAVERAQQAAVRNLADTETDAHVVAARQALADLLRELGEARDAASGVDAMEIRRALRGQAAALREGRDLVDADAAVALHATECEARHRDLRAIAERLAVAAKDYQLHLDLLGTAMGKRNDFNSDDWASSLSDFSRTSDLVAVKRSGVTVRRPQALDMILNDLREADEAREAAGLDGDGDTTPRTWPPRSPTRVPAGDLLADEPERQAIPPITNAGRPGRKHARTRGS